MRLIHLTDPHLSSLASLSFRKLRGKRRSGYLSWQKNRQHVHRVEVLDRLTEAVANHAPDQVLLTGDLVHIGLESEMIEAADWLRRLAAPEKIMFVPGNHDNYAADSLQAMRRHWADYLPADVCEGGDYTAGYPLVLHRQGLKLVGVNTACVTRIFSAAGELGDAQRLRLARALENPPGENVFNCLLIHHPPFPGMTRRRKALRDAEQLLGIAGQRRPDLVLYGHIHRNREALHNGTRSYCTASASSIRNASFRIIDLDQGNAGWHCHMRLMTLAGGAPFTLAAESSWQVPAC